MNTRVGKIKTVALTNFDTERLQIILENDIPVVSNQVYSFHTYPFRACLHLDVCICPKFLICGRAKFFRCNIQLLICVHNRKWQSSVSLRE